MSMNLETLGVWPLVILVALNAAALGLWIVAAKFCVVLGTRVSGTAAVPSSPTEVPEPPAPEPAPPAKSTSGPVHEQGRPVAANRGERRLAEDLERWRKRLDAIQAEAGA